MDRLTRRGFFVALCALATLPGPSSAAENAARKLYAFELVTLNLSSRSRAGRDPATGTRMQINVASTMSDEELETVGLILDRLGASAPDQAGFRHFTLANGSRGRLGFMTDPQIAGAGVHSMSMEFSVEDQFSNQEAALVMEIAVEANLFVAHPEDATVVATTYAITDRPFRKAHPRATVTSDAASLAEWVRQNIPPREEGGAG